MTIGGNLSGNGTLVKNGSHQLTLLGTNTRAATVSSFGGNISPEEGTLALTSGASVTGLTSIDIQPGAILALELFDAGDLNMLGVDGNFTTDGTLCITFASGATSPQSGDTFDLFDFVSMTDGFDTQDLPTLAAGLSWNTSNLLTTGELSIEGTALADDLDGDGFVGLAIWTSCCLTGTPAHQHLETRTSPNQTHCLSWVCVAHT